MQNIQVPSKQTIPFSENAISINALKVVSELQAAGFQAYLVGGCVRDLLLNLHPKDFDVTTDAKPEEVKSLFRNSRLVGRRFRLAHIRFGREIIEVATFRRHYNAGNGSQTPSQSNQYSTATTSHQGMVLSDNIYGTVEEDALRRDFTINALYYDPASQELIDYTHRALQDIADRKLCLIGEPEVRFREDPVRMLRAVRFMAKLGFDIDKDCHAAIKQQHHLLSHIPAARLFDESIKLFHCGQAATTYQLLKSYHLLDWLFPLTYKCIKTHPGFEGMIELALKNTDARIAMGKPVTPAFLFAVLLWQPLCNAHRPLLGKRGPFYPMLQKASQQVIAQQCRSISIPKRHSLSVREMWDLQYRLSNRSGKNVQRVMEHPRFRAAYDFILLRELAGEIQPGLGQWWTDYQAADTETRIEMINILSAEKRQAAQREK